MNSEIDGSGAVRPYNPAAMSLGDQLSRLDSSAGAGAPWNWIGVGRLAFISCDARSLVTTVNLPNGATKQWSDPLEALRWMESFVRNDAPRSARWVGYFGYDLGRLFERLPVIAKDDLDVPLFAFALETPDVNADPTGSDRRSSPGGQIRSTFSRDEYERAVQRVIDYIAAGDVFQVNLSQRFTVPCDIRARVIYERLHTTAPAKHAALLEYDTFALICNSPELFLHVAPQPDGSRRVITRPIKGTRPRGAGMERELRNSLKDQAELNMIVDLERNDLGRVCEIGSVRVTEPRAIEEHPTIYHGVATIEGTLRRDVGLVELLRATFPGGSITGAPKIRAMEIIEELEPVRRGPYCGAIGYLAAEGSMEFNIAIRTMILKDNQAHIPVGGGIVADSDPAAEYEETLIKARAMFAALGISHT